MAKYEAIECTANFKHDENFGWKEMIAVKEKSVPLIRLTNQDGLIMELQLTDEQAEFIREWVKQNA